MTLDFQNRLSTTKHIRIHLKEAVLNHFRLLVESLIICWLTLPTVLANILSGAKFSETIK